VLSYDVDSRDCTDPSAATIRKNAVAVTARGVVSPHLGYRGTLATGSSGLVGISCAVTPL
jgi:hypothetical protein